jgi:ankyrin repeat protein
MKYSHLGRTFLHFCLLLIIVSVAADTSVAQKTGRLLYRTHLTITNSKLGPSKKLTANYNAPSNCNANNAQFGLQVGNAEERLQRFVLEPVTREDRQDVQQGDVVYLVATQVPGASHSAQIAFCPQVFPDATDLVEVGYLKASVPTRIMFVIDAGLPHGTPIMLNSPVRLVSQNAPVGPLGVAGAEPLVDFVRVGVFTLAARDNPNKVSAMTWLLNAATPLPNAPAPVQTPAPTPIAVTPQPAPVTTTMIITTTTTQPGTTTMVGVNELNPSTKQAMIHNSVQNQDVNGVRTLLQQGADPNLVEGNQGRTPMHIATTKGDANMIRLLKESGGNINARDNNGKTSLDLALESNDNSTARILLNNGASAAEAKSGVDRVIERRDTDMMRTLLQNGANGPAVASKAIATDNVEILAVTLQSGTRASNEMFNEAARQRSSKCANELLRNGIDKGQAMDQVIATNDMQMVDLILLSGVDVPTANKALIYSIQQRDMRMASIAVERNYADPNAGMPVAVENNNIQAVEYLLSKRADANAQMDEAAAGGKNDIVNAFLRAGANANGGVLAAASNDRVSTLQILLDAGGDANLAMPEAIEKGSLPMVNMCLSARNRADVSRTEYVVKTCEKSNRDILQVLLFNGAKPDPGMPICIANRNSGMVDQLIKAGAAVDRPDYMTKACQQIDAPIVRLLLDANANPNPGMPIAVELGDANIVAMLLEKKADGTNPQYIDNASGKGFSSIVTQLLKAGADPNTGMTSAVKNNRLEVVTQLLAAGADGSMDQYMIASVKHNNPNLTSTLITAGGKVDVALEPAVENNSDKVVSLLKDKGVDVTPVKYLVTCVKSNHTQTARVLVNAGASADWWDESKGCGLLHITIDSYLNPEMTGLLIQAGADVNRKETINGNSPLHLAATNSKNQMETAATIIKMLIAAKADVNAVNNKGQTVLKACPDRPILQKPLKEAGAVNKLK